MGNEPIEKCSNRLAKALAIRGMKQHELCEKTKIPKSAISQYLSGAFEPKQDRLYIIAQALDVDPVWLMGFDVPMEKEDSPSELQLTEGEKALIKLLRRVPAADQPIVIEKILSALDTQE
jgi:transcriptional regulator with XRE-family HTH domain